MRYSVLISIAISLLSCGNGENEPDAYGNFFVEEILISAETSGKILLKTITEGEEVQEDQLVYLLDTVQSYLKRQELAAKRQAVISQRSGVHAQIAVLKEQQNALEQDITRIKRMLEKGASSQKQLDDLMTQRNVSWKKIDQVTANFTSIEAETAAIEAGIQQVEDLLDRAYVRAPLTGIILETYAEPGESAAPGKPLFRMAAMDTLEMKAYFTGNQLVSLQTGDEVNVLIDDGAGDVSTLTGVVSWIATNAEFTPKIIQTREERVNLVYAVKIRVPNDGSLRINMPGEVKLTDQH